MSDSPQFRRSRRKLDYPKQETAMQIRVFRDELERMKELAKRAGKTLSSYVRDSALAPQQYNPSLQTHANSLPIESLFPQTAKEEGRASDSSQKKSARLKELAEDQDIIGEKTGHRNGCTCFVCERLRALLEK
jgi:hypothetical protein